MTHLDVVQAVRAQYPTPLYPDYSAAFLAALCQRLKQVFPTEAVGLRRKDTGTHTTLSDGTPVALDILMYLPDGQAYDVLSDSDGAAVPTWNAIGQLPMDWYVPVSGEPTPPPPPSDLEERVAHLEAAVMLLSSATIKHGDRISLESAHQRFLRAGDLGEQWDVDQAEQVLSWEQWIARKL